MCISAGFNNEIHLRYEHSDQIRTVILIQSNRPYLYPLNPCAVRLRGFYMSNKWSRGTYFRRAYFRFASIFIVSCTFDSCESCISCESLGFVWKFDFIIPFFIPLLYTFSNRTKPISGLCLQALSACGLSTQADKAYFLYFTSTVTIPSDKFHPS